MCSLHVIDILPIYFYQRQLEGFLFLFFMLRNNKTGGNLFFLLKRKGEREQIATLANCS
jgi:hypothetical protein